MANPPVHRVAEGEGFEPSLASRRFTSLLKNPTDVRAEGIQTSEQVPAVHAPGVKPDRSHNRPKIVRFLARVEKTDSCWLWIGGTHKSGYGRYDANQDAHRVAYELYKGPIPNGLHIDHLCRVKRCVNPAHLEAVTSRENALRGIKGALTTHCPHGHPYDEANTYRREGSPTTRYCRACWTRKRQERKAKEAVNG